MDGRRDVFQAIADPNRRRIIELIAVQPQNLNAIAENFKISRPAVSQHVKILRECGLVEVQKQGRERVCTARMEKLDEVTAWVEKYRNFWNNKLDNLEQFLNSQPNNPKENE